MIKLKSPLRCDGCGRQLVPGIDDNHAVWRKAPGGRWRPTCADQAAAPPAAHALPPPDFQALRDRCEAAERERDSAREVADKEQKRADWNLASACAANKRADAAEALAAEAREQARNKIATLVIQRPDCPEVRLDTPPAALADLVFELGLGHHVMMVGPAGSGKTTLAQLAAQALGLPYHLLTFSPGMTEGSLFGRQDATGRYHRSAFISGYEDGGLICLDEFDNGDPSTVASLNPALANGHCPVPARSDAPLAAKHERSVIVGTANTFGLGPDALYVRNQLDAATLDRFVVLYVDYDSTLEERIVAPEVLQWGLRIRSAIQTHRLRRIMSTRTLVRASAWAKAGKPQSYWDSRYFAPWSESERKQVDHA